MRTPLRSKVWWPKMDSDTEHYVRACKGCTLVSAPNPPNQCLCAVQPWIDKAIDYLGAFPSGHYVLVNPLLNSFSFRRQFSYKLPSAVDVEFADLDLERKDKDTEMKAKGKEYADSKRHAAEYSIDVGEKVYVKNMTKENKLSTTFNDAPHSPHTIINKGGNDVEVQNDNNGQRLRRNIIHLKRVEGQWKVCKDDIYADITDDSILIKNVLVPI